MVRKKNQTRSTESSSSSSYSASSSSSSYSSSSYPCSSSSYSSSSSYGSQSSSFSTDTKLRISAERYTRLRNLLLNSHHVLPPISVDNNLAVARISKAILSLYERLSCDGFSDDQIERALSFLNGRDSIDAALDFLCLNLPGNELPPKFSDVTSQDKAEGGTVGVVLKAREDWVPSSRSYPVPVDKVAEVPVKISGRRDYGNTLDSPGVSQSDWIRKYVEQQDEDEDDEKWCDDLDERSFSTEKMGPMLSEESIVKAYKIARLDALRAKERGDKKCQQQAGEEIRKLKQEIAALGLCDDILDFSIIDKTADQPVDEYSSNGEECSVPDLVVGKSSEKECSTEISKQSFVECSPLVEFNPEEVTPENGSNDDMEFGNIFAEDLNSIGILPPYVADTQMLEKMKPLSSPENMDKLNGIWKKGDQKKLPKSVLHQMCRRSGWEAPKFTKLHSNKHHVSYSVSVMRTSSGRGKNRKAGGLITIQLPNEDENSVSIEDSQNSVSAFALCCLFPDIPLQIVFTEPYAFLAVEWKKGVSVTEIEKHSEDRRTAFVKSLLNSLVNDTDKSSGLMGDIYHEKTDGRNPHGKTKFLNDDITHNGCHFDVESLYLKRHYENKQKMLKYQDIMKARSGLPITKLKEQILGLLKENDVLVICGETGCGKTTQVPQFILEDMIEAGYGGRCNIICTQPRRIAAISVAERVAYERCEGLPGSESSLVGYQVRLSSSRNENTKLLFCTTGILLRKMTGDPNLLDITHVIVDEVHERTVLGDFLLIVLKNLIEKSSAQRKEKLKIILMSATMDSKLFSTYFCCCPVIIAEGRTFPVTTYFLEDVYESLKYKLASDSPASIEQEHNFYGKKSSGYHKVKKDLGSLSVGDATLITDDYINPFYISSCYQSYSVQTQLNLKRLCEEVIDYELMEDLVFYIDENFAEGAILVFLPGVSEIYILLERLCGSYRFGGPASDWIFPLHSSISPSEQKKVFLQPPVGIRKIIIATNIAETSITIDDVVYVIDCGRHKEKRYNTQKKLSSMVEDWISRANARQRRGRAGRVKPGILFCMFTSHRYEKLMRPYQVPEMLRVQLTELCLQVKMLSLGDIKSFLLKALEPPSDAAVTSAVSLLHEVGAIQGDEELTPLGYHLARLPVDVSIGKMMLFGGIFCCLSPILSISAFMSYKSPFSFKKDQQKNVDSVKLALLNDGQDCFYKLVPSDRQSDHIILASAYSKWEKVLQEKGSKDAETFCNKHFLISSVMYMIRDMRVQFGTLLADIGLIDLPTKSQIEGRNKDNLAYSLSDKSQIFNSYSHQTSIVKAILVAGLYPNVAATEEGIMGTTMNSLKHNFSQSTLSRPVWYDGKREVHVHHSSINGHLKAVYYPFLVFLEKVETSKIFLRDTSVVSPSSIMLFGGSVDIQYRMGLVSIGGWLKLKAPAQTAVLFKELRSNLESVLQGLIKKPQMRNVDDNAVLKAIVDLLSEEDKATG